MENECKDLNKRFFTFHTKRRPFVVLKWAETANHIIGSNTNERMLISNATSNKLVHKWRSEEAAILVGTNTALFDNPSLSNRLWTGKQPTRLIIDKELKLPKSLNVFDKSQSTIVFNFTKQQNEGNLRYYKLDRNKELLQQIMETCYQLNIQSVLVEGGSKTLQSFIDNNLWDEARVITNTKLSVANGTPSPTLFNSTIKETMMIGEDRIVVSCFRS